MAEEEKVKLEIELPESQVSIEREGQKPDEEKEKKEEKSLIKKATGYEAGEIIKAPASPPEPEETRKPRRSQIRVIVIGLAIVFMALIIAGLLGWRIGVATALIGAVFVAVGTFVRI